MSRIGRKVINISDKVDVKVDAEKVEVKGPKGSLSLSIDKKVKVVFEDKELKVLADYKNDIDSKKMMGTTQALLSNMVNGVEKGFVKNLTLVGVGYRAQVQKNDLNLTLGYSHPVTFKLPDTVTATVTGNTKIKLESCNKQLLGQVASDIQSLRRPEPYKGKGILIEGQRLIRKVGKAGKK